MRTNLKKQINNECENLIESDFSIIKNKIKNNEGEILIMEKEKKNKIIWLSSLSAGLVAAAFGVVYLTSADVTTVTLDVNPSFELEFKNGKLSDIDAINNDANELLKNLNLEGMTVEESTEMLLAELIKHGYITEENNSVLLSIDDSDESKNIKEELTLIIEKYLAGNNINSSIINVEYEDDNDKEAEKYNISVGKMELIKKIVSIYDDIDIEDLIELSTSELSRILSGNFNQDGEQTAEVLVSEDGVKKIVLADANVLESELIDYDFDVEVEDKQIIFEIEFETVNNKYEYEYDVLSNSIVKKEVEVNDDYYDDLNDDNDDDRDDNDDDDRDDNNDDDRDDNNDDDRDDNDDDDNDDDRDDNDDNDNDDDDDRDDNDDNDDDNDND